MQSKKQDVIVLRATSVASRAPTCGPTVYYDGSCPLCSAEINHYASRSGGNNLHLVDVSVEHAELGSDLTSEKAMSRFHVRKQDGELLSGARAFVEVWRALPGWSWASRLANIPGVLHVMEVAYRSSLVVRPVISKLAGRLGFQAENQQPARPRKADELEN